MDVKPENQNNKIWLVSDPMEEKLLRRQTVPFDFAAFSRAQISKLIADMRRAMKAANGIGLSANQVGLPFKMFIAQVPAADGSSKFYAVFNPKIEKTSKEMSLKEEGCLSVPGVYGSVKRYERVTLRGFDRNGKPLKLKAWGLPAHVFQHETDHLNGVLFTDKAQHLHEKPTD